MDNVSMELKIEHVSLELHKAEIHRRKGEYKNVSTSDEKDDKIFIEFEIEAIPEKRPFLLSRDFAYVRPSGTQAKPFQVSFLTFSINQLWKHRSMCTCRSKKLQEFLLIRYQLHLYLYFRGE